MTRKKSVRWQLIIGNTSIYILLMVGMGLFIYFANFSAQVKAIQSQNAHLLSAMQYRVEQYFMTPVAMIDQMRAHINKNSEVDRGTLNTYLGTLIKVYPYIEQIKVIDAQGKVDSIVPHSASAIGTSVIYEDFYLKRPLDNKVIWSEVYLSQKTFRPTVTVTALAGNWLIAGDLDLSKMTDMMLANKMDSVVSMSILDQYGTYLVDANIKNVEQRRQFADFSHVKAAAHKGDRLIPLKVNPNLLFTAISVGSDNQWYLVVVEDKRVLYKSLQDLMSYLVVALFLVGVGTALFMYFNTNRIMKDLKALEIGTHFISSGDYTQKLQGSKFSEFQNFSECFNAMIESVETREEEIHALNDALEQTVKLRTEELVVTNNLLEEANAQLEEEVVEKQTLTDELIYANKSLEERVFERTQQLQEASQYKSEFLANMSHEIRTPMNGILGMINVIELTALTEEQEQYVRTVKSSADSLLTILNDILDFSKIEAGKIVIKEEPFNLQNTIEDLKSLFLASAQHKNLAFDVYLSETLPHHYLGDDNRIRQVISNLIGNAIKFTAQGSVKVHVKGTDLGDKRIQLAVVVEDTGIGISEQDQERLFERFTQFNIQSRSGIKGTGLGLAISKMLTDLMGGSISVSSQLGKGSMFIFGLTLKVDDTATPLGSGQKMNALQESMDLKGIKVLIAEDDQTSLYMMNAMLKKLSAEVFFALNGQEAIEMAQTHPVDMILMDVNMPVMDGLTASKAIRELGLKSIGGMPVPMIAMTAYALAGDREKCIEAGMTDYISKPVNFKVLIEKMKMYWQAQATKAVEESQGDTLAIDSLETALPSKSAGEDKENMVIETYEEICSKLMQASGLDESTCEIVLKTYLEQTADILQSIHLAIDKGDLEPLGILLHKLKGSSGNVRADEIMKLALKAEMAYHASEEVVLNDCIKLISISVQGLFDHVEKSS